MPRNHPCKKRCHFSDALETTNLPIVFSASFYMRLDCISFCNLQGTRETNTRKRLRSAPEDASLPCRTRHLEPIIEEFNQRSCRCIATVEDTYTKRVPLVVSARRERGREVPTSRSTFWASASRPAPERATPRDRLAGRDRSVACGGSHRQGSKLEGTREERVLGRFYCSRARNDSLGYKKYGANANTCKIQTL